jgi:hypothetical protein
MTETTRQESETENASHLSIYIYAPREWGSILSEMRVLTSQRRRLRPLVKISKYHRFEVTRYP